MFRNFLIENWEKFTKAAAPKRIQIVPTSSCLEDYGNDIVFLFVDNASYPEYVLKASRNPTFGHKLENEYYSLKNASNNQKVSTYIPTPYYLGSYNLNHFFLQKGLHGVSLFKLIRQKGINKRTHFLINQSIDILVEIGKTESVHKLTEIESIYMEEHFFAIAKEELVSSHNKQKIGKLIEYQQVLKKENHNFYIHGDYWGRNIIVDYRTTEIKGVIDWEFSHSGAIYPKDIIWFIMNLGYNLGLCRDSEMSILDAYKWAFFTPGNQNKLIASCFRRYMEAIGWDKNLLSMLLEMTLLEMSMREFIAYGRHSKIDEISKKMFLYTIRNEDSLCVI